MNWRSRGRRHRGTREAPWPHKKLVAPDGRLKATPSTLPPEIGTKVRPKTKSLKPERKHVGRPEGTDTEVADESIEELYLVHDPDLFRALLGLIAEFVLFQLSADLHSALYV